MGRNILLITTDQMRFDALGCNGGIVARTPVIDALAAEGINYSTGSQPKRRMYASSGNHYHRATRLFTRRLDERRVSSRGRLHNRSSPSGAWL